MPAFVFVEINIIDHKLYEEYKKLTPKTVSDFGGKFIVRGGKTEVLEGDPSHNRMVLLEFPSIDAAQAWWNSQEYTRARLIRQRAATTRMILLEGSSE